MSSGNYVERKGRDYETLAHLARTGSREDRIAALQALGELGDRRAVDLLRGALKDEDIDIRRTAARALYQTVADRAEETLDQDTIRHLLRLHAPEEILSSATAIRLFLSTLDVLSADSVALDLEHGDGAVVSGSPMDGYQALTLRNAGLERDTDGTVRRILSFFQELKGEPGGWWTIGPARGAGIIAFRQGDRFGETLYELAIARIAPDRYLTLTTCCRYADWD